MRWLFWSSAFLVAYVYVGYLLLLMVWARLFPNPPRTDLRQQPDVDPPFITIILAVRNEASRLQARLENLLELDYPAHRRQIVVVSDGSTDGTPGVLAGFRNHVEVVLLAESGKAAALNAGVARATGEILIFADARQTFAPDVAKALTLPFADPGIGGVSGELVLGCEPRGGRRQGAERRGESNRGRPDRRRDHGSTMATGIRHYWSYEKQLRRLESTVGSMLGATGAVYALRRSLWRPLPDGTILDDVLAPMRAVLAGSRVVFEPRAQAYDRTSPDASAEKRRKIRTLAGNVQILLAEPRLLIPIVNPVWLQYASHKIGRLLVPYALLGLLVSSVALATDHLFYAAAALLQVAFYLESAYGGWLEYRRRKAAFRPYTLAHRAGAFAFAFVMLNATAVVGLVAGLSGRKVWR